MAKKIKPEQLSYEVGNILTEYSSEVAKAASRAAKEVGEKTADDLKQTSPKRTGKYAKS